MIDTKSEEIPLEFEGHKEECTQAADVAIVGKGLVNTFKSIGINDMDAKYLGSYGAVSKCLQKFKCKECSLMHIENQEMTLHLPKGMYEEAFSSMQSTIESILVAFVIRFINESPEVTTGNILQDIITTFADKKSSESLQKSFKFHKDLDKQISSISFGNPSDLDKPISSKARKEGSE